MSLSQQRPFHSSWMMTRGGTETWLPRPLESCLAWTLAISCLSVSGYHYWVENYVMPYAQFFRTSCFYWLFYYMSNNSTARLFSKIENQKRTTESATMPCWLPLMTYSRAELDRATPELRLTQLRILLESSLFPQTLSTGSSDDCCGNHVADNTDDRLVHLLRNHPVLRRLVSLAMRPSSTSTKLLYTPTTDLLGNEDRLLRQQLIRIWPRLLPLPPPVHTTTRKDDSISSDHWEISLIVPCYNERLADVVENLNVALDNSARPGSVQVVIVLAGTSPTISRHSLLSAMSCTMTANNNTTPATSMLDRWGHVLVVEFSQETGRGPCLNYGATHADGEILSFCHSDTKLPHHWDASLVNTWQANTHNYCDSSTTIANARQKLARCNACAFGFGIDTTAHGLKGGPRPPGICAVQTTANLRCQWWSLPYGDQCLSMRATDFWYLGGFPHQCFMEDYELIALLRKRVRLLPQFQPKDVPGHRYDIDVEPETLAIITGAPALCSPRRWQRYGVLYVTFTNSRLVNRYASGMSPDELYRQYYGQALANVAPQSPWEIELEGMLQNVQGLEETLQSRRSSSLYSTVVD